MVNEPVTVVGWNLDGSHTISDAQLALIDAAGPQLLLAQEVTQSSLDRLRAAGWQAAAALELVDDDHTERDGARPSFGCAVLARGPACLEAASMLADAPSPDGRSIWSAQRCHLDRCGTGPPRSARPASSPTTSRHRTGRRC